MVVGTAIGEGAVVDEVVFVGTLVFVTVGIDVSICVAVGFNIVGFNVFPGAFETEVSLVFDCCKLPGTISINQQ